MATADEPREDADEDREKSLEDEALSDEVKSERDAPSDDESKAEDDDGATSEVKASSEPPRPRRGKSQRPPQRGADLPQKQATSARGTVLGVVAYAAILGAAYGILPEVRFLGASDRLAYALGLLVFPALMMALGVGAVALSRYSSDAIDPLARAERGEILVHSRYLSNTTEQLVLHAVAVLGLAAEGSAFSMRILPGLVACFVVGRAAFWLGYLREPLARGPGFAMTLQPTVLALLYLAGRGAIAVFSR
ncbi:MAG: MAPEG family protein [Myxococcales bacterium]|jgi:hypothetical protein|nr:MAPEG family protein [Myxococcales bacterium]